MPSSWVYTRFFPIFSCISFEYSSDFASANGWDGIGHAHMHHLRRTEEVANGHSGTNSHRSIGLDHEQQFATGIPFSSAARGITRARDCRLIDQLVTRGQKVADICTHAGKGNGQ